MEEGLHELVTKTRAQEWESCKQVRGKLDKVKGMVTDINDLDQLISARAGKRGGSRDGVKVSGTSATIVGGRRSSKGKEKEGNVIDK